MIKFLQHNSSRYPPRTFENASADATIAFAFDFTTPGEILTKEAVRTQGKMYISVNPNTINNQKISNDALRLKNLLHGNATTLNIAGNGAYTNIKYGFTQQQCDQLVFEYLHKLIEYELTITLIRSGGQSGFDEAGLKAAVLLNIPALCVCPQGWKFNDQTGKIICDEKLFKGRFNQKFIL